MSRNPIYVRNINSKRWKELRHKKLIRNPVCELCAEKGISRSATEVHHVIPVESTSDELQMKSLMFNEHNLMSLCHECHKGIHHEMLSHTKENIKAARTRRTKTFLDKYL